MASQQGVDEKQNLKNGILESASELFMKNGYTATSIKQIAKAAGCTTAALYYYYEDGKLQILEAVIQDTIVGKFLPVLEQIKGKDSLEEMLLAFGEMMCDEAPQVAERLSWIMLEFDHLDESAQNIVRKSQMKFHQSFHDEVARFIPEDAEKAKIIASIVQFCYFGFAQFSSKFGMAAIEFDFDRFSRTVAKSLSQYQD